jgi:hypothetical protein
MWQRALQVQSVFPAMGYISLAVEAVAAAAGDRKLGLIRLENVVIGRALSFDDENTGVETKITLRVVRSTSDELSARSWRKHVNFWLMNANRNYRTEVQDKRVCAIKW